jgi:Leucine-rich repeat (LRR) protein
MRLNITKFDQILFKADATGFLPLFNLGGRIKFNRIVKKSPEILFLHLGRNRLASLPPEIEKLVNLRYLILNNHLEAIDLEGDPTMQTMQTLWIQFLSVSPSDHTSFEPNIFLRDENSTDIDRNNRINVLPPQIGNLGNLRILDLNGIGLNSLPDEIGNLHSLEELDAGNNALINIPLTIGQITNLKRVDLSNNMLSALPSTIVNLQHLEVLDVSDNILTSPPQGICDEGIEAIREWFENGQRNNG